MSPAVDGMVPCSLDVPDHQILFRLVSVIRSGQVEEGDVDGEEVIERLRTLQGKSLEDGAHAEVWIGSVASGVVEDEAEEVEVEEVSVEGVVEVEKAVEESVAVSVSCGGDLVEDGRVQVRVVGGGVGAGWQNGSGKCWSQQYWQPLFVEDVLVFADENPSGVLIDLFVSIVWPQFCDFI